MAGAKEYIDWNPPQKENTGAAEFRVYHDSKKHGTLSWGEAMKNIKGRENPLTLYHEYEILWQNYSNFTDAKFGEFRFALISVSSNQKG